MLVVCAWVCVFPRRSSLFAELAASARLRSVRLLPAADSAAQIVRASHSV